MILNQRRLWLSTRRTASSAMKRFGGGRRMTTVDTKRLMKLVLESVT